MHRGWFFSRRDMVGIFFFGSWRWRAGMVACMGWWERGGKMVLVLWSLVWDEMVEWCDLAFESFK